MLWHTPRGWAGWPCMGPDSGRAPPAPPHPVQWGPPWPGRRGAPSMEISAPRARCGGTCRRRAAAVPLHPRICTLACAPQPPQYDVRWQLNNTCSIPPSGLSSIDIANLSLPAPLAAPPGAAPLVAAWGSCADHSKWGLGLPLPVDTSTPWWWQPGPRAPWVCICDLNRCGAGGGQRARGRWPALLQHVNCRLGLAACVHLAAGCLHNPDAAAPAPAPIRPRGCGGQWRSSCASPPTHAPRPEQHGSAAATAALETHT